MNKVILGLGVLLLSGCGPQVNDKDAAAMVDQAHEFDIICLEGVQYWSKYIGSNGGIMAPRISKDSLLPVRCTSTQPQETNVGVKNNESF